ncbi:MAG TPA: glycoside hydrolase family 2 TIM barrel-domain containing protein [Phycisphaerae bacterium]|nr:glycoside hydrolase family 2 TIM barrel-domain containing protein [Phycisphaerae bacterium]HRW52911.1 glycoside hydrolase family 2 TIM barrel-domain containing protein [Phycisphaerae bacterium]
MRTRSAWRKLMWVLSGVMLSPMAVYAAAPIRTTWADQVKADSVLPEYPRPQMTRRAWTNLNGHWDYAITPRGTDKPTSWAGKILVPFCIESDLSGVAGRVGPENELWYHRTFRAPDGWKDRRTLLHFGAADWKAYAYVNGKRVGAHQGGYDAFSFDITDALQDGDNELVVRVWDPTGAGYQPRGKQTLNPNGIWYTAVTGIWGTVWMETVPRTFIHALRIDTDFAANTLKVGVETAGETAGYSLELDTMIGGLSYHAKAKAGEPLTLTPETRIPVWSPTEPTLHEFTIELKDARGNTIDHVGSYFGFRSIEIRKDSAGVNRLFLNGEPLFQYGPLDQGWWPEGLYTAPTDEALKYDLEVTKRLGFNMVRKHVKVEPARWYYWCDKLGLLVWQDMPSGDAYINSQQPDIRRTAQSGYNFERELRRMIEGLYNHPCIVMWVPYNEGWGQWETARIVEFVRGLDSTRLVDNTSGWADRNVGDVLDIHSYPAPRIDRLDDRRAVVNGEFGGLGLPMKGHLWQEKDNWGYRTYETQAALTDAYCNMLGDLHRLVGRGVAAAVYTQTTDVEGEVNGLMTYDRSVLKMDEARAAAAANRLYTTPPKVTTILPTSAESGAMWRYTTTRPDADWAQPTFDDSTWTKGKGGFGTRGTPGAKVGTTWGTGDIWIRRRFTLDAIPSAVELNIHHDEDAEVFINGTRVASLKEYTTDYSVVAMDDTAIRAMKTGENVIAIHCHQTNGGQYIDAGLVSVE